MSTVITDKDCPFKFPDANTKKFFDMMRAAANGKPTGSGGISSTYGDTYPPKGYANNIGNKKW